MKSGRAFVYRFYFPLVLSLTLAVVATLIPSLITPSTTILEAELIKIGVLGIKIPLAEWSENVWIARLAIYGWAAALFAYGVSLDFSKYFPTRLKFDVYFDVKGIERTLNQIPSGHWARLELDADWKDDLPEYDQDVVASLRALWASQNMPNMWPHDPALRDLLHASGETTFVVNRIGFLTYKITQSEGSLAYEADIPRQKRQTFRGAFHLRDSDSNYIRPNLLTLLKSPTILIAPQFMQVFQLDAWPTSGTFDHILVAATRISLIPVPAIGDTLYLWKSHKGGWIPIAYCIYNLISRDGST